MSKVTRKYQVSVPKALADRYGIRPGDDLRWEACGENLRVVPARGHRLNAAERLRAFDETTRRIEARQSDREAGRPRDREWTREDLYDERVRSR